LALAGEGSADAASLARFDERPALIATKETKMSALAYIVATVAIFALLGLVVRLVEGR
jgi:hypothetical protein